MVLEEKEKLSQWCITMFRENKEDERQKSQITTKTPCKNN